MVNTARTVVYRHPCDCETASRPLEPGEKPEHRFDVDGQPFPWHLAEDGATFAMSATGLYLVTVPLLPIVRANNEPLRTIVDLDGMIAFEHVDGQRQVFPWITTDTLEIACQWRGMPVITLTFLAEHVDTDTAIAEESEASPS